MNKKFNGKTLSKELWGIGLDSSDKILIDEIISLSKQPNGCYASDEHFAELIEESKKNASRRIQKLKKQGRIFVSRERDGKKWKRTIKFLSLVGSIKSLPSKTILEKDNLSLSKNIEKDNLSIVEKDNLSIVEKDNLGEGDGQIVSGILQYKETPEEPETKKEKFEKETGEKNTSTYTGPNVLANSFLLGDNTNKENLAVDTRPFSNSNINQSEKESIPNKHPEILGPDEKLFNLKVEEVGKVLDEIIELDIFSKQEKNKLIELKGIKYIQLIKYIEDRDNSEYEIRALEPRLNRIFNLYNEIKTIKNRIKN